MKPSVLRLGRLVLFFCVAAALFFGLRVPQAIGNLREKHEVIRQLQKDNANLAKEVAEKREHVRKLRGDRNEIELEIKKRMKLQREGETGIVVPGQAK